MRKKITILLLGILLVRAAQAQEIQAKVTILSQQLSTAVNKNIFNTLQNQLTNMINSRKWTKDVFQPQEKIQANFLINLQSVIEDNVYKGTLTIQAARPVFNASYQSPLINFQDIDLVFKYVEYQSVDFNETNVSGSNSLAANLPAVMAFYVYMILGLDYDSFELKGGDPHFKKALYIVSNAPEETNITGWKAFDGNRNRYWLANNVTNPRLNEIHDILYTYYRDGLDFMYEDEMSARVNILAAIDQLVDFNQLAPNSMILQLFMQGRSDELVGIFKKADPATKARAIEILTKIDVSNTTKYRTELK